MKAKTQAGDSIIVFLAAFGLFGLFLWTGYLPLDNDALYADVARGMVASGDWLNPQIYGVPFLDKPPFLYWLLGSSIGVLGESSLSLRLTSAVFGALAVMLVYRAATADRGLWTKSNEPERSSFGGRVPGIVAAVFLIGVPIFAEYARRVYMEVPVAVCVFASIAFFDRAAARLNAGVLDKSAFVLAGALTGAGFMFKSLVGLFGAIPSVLFMVIVLRRRVFSKSFVLGGGLALISFLVVVAPWHVQQLLHQPEVFTEFTWKLHVEEQVLAAQPWSTGPPWFYAALFSGPQFAIGLGFVFGVGSVALQAARQRAWNTWDVHLALSAVVIFVILSSSETKKDLYVVPLVPIVATLAGRSLAPHLQMPALRRGLPWLLLAVGLARTLPLYDPGGSFLAGAEPLVPAARAAGGATPEGGTIHVVNLYFVGIQYYGERRAISHYTNPEPARKTGRIPYIKYGKNMRYIAQTDVAERVREGGTWVLPTALYEQLFPSKGQAVEVVYEDSGLTVVRADT